MTDKSTRSSPRPALTQTLEAKLANPETSPEFDLQNAVNDVLGDVGLTVADGGGKLTFYGQDPIIASPFRFGSMAAIGLAARSVALAALWKHRTGEGQDISMDVRKALIRFYGFFDLKWETINGRPPSAWGYAGTPFFKQPMLRETRDGRHVMAMDFYPKLRARMLNFLRCSEDDLLDDSTIGEARGSRRYNSRKARDAEEAFSPREIFVAAGTSSTKTQAGRCCQFSS